MIKLFKILWKSILAFIGFILVYLLSAYILSRISINQEQTYAKPEVIIYIKTNGVHTDIVMPTKNEQIDWSRQIKFTDTKIPDTTQAYLGVGWGDRGFYLETPTWAELKPSVAFNAAFGLGTTAIHATYYSSLSENESCKKILLTKEQYIRLIAFITKSFQKDENGSFINIKTNANYGNTDAFYEANGTYSLFHTCNTWANSALKTCGQRCCLWTPFQKGIFLHYK